MGTPEQDLSKYLQEMQDIEKREDAFDKHVEMERAKINYDGQWPSAVIENLHDWFDRNGQELIPLIYGDTDEFRELFLRQFEIALQEHTTIALDRGWDYDDIDFFDMAI